MSGDYDGCCDIITRKVQKKLLNSYLKDGTQITKEFVLLLERCAVEILVKKFSQCTDLFSGSNRQSKSRDKVLAHKNKNGSSIDLFESIAKLKSDIILHKDFLSPETNEDLENLTLIKSEEVDGWEGQRAKKVPKNPNDTIFKPLLVFFQMSQMARLYPHSFIEFYFFDDLYAKDVWDFFESRHDLIPQNLELNCIKFRWFAIIEIYLENDCQLPNFESIISNERVYKIFSSLKNNVKKRRL
ncbi:MAG: hypothetical protein CMP11_09510 [Zetaproteobacteria bacterium]|nr:hypothetical protein [Pseudobdellovibrionaceae bacterium]